MLRVRGRPRSTARFRPEVPLPVARSPQPLVNRLANGAAGVLGRVGVRLGPALEPAALVAEAEAASGLSGFTEPDLLLAGLEVAARSLEREARLSLAGRVWTHGRLVELLVRRLHVDRDLAAHPEILGRPLAGPVVVVGMPRTGTTLLHNLLTRLAGARWLRPWELDEPWPDDGTATAASDPEGAEAADPRAVAFRRTLARHRHLQPHLDRQHPFDSPAECNDLFMATFVSNRFAIFWDTPAYAAWLDGRGREDWSGAYRHYRSQLQRLSWKRPGERWVLKSPHHLGHLDELLEALPGARVIHLHREPRQVIGSLASHVASLRYLSSNRVDLRRLGRFLLDGLAATVEAAIAARERLGGGRFHDLAFRDLVADPVASTVATLRAAEVPVASASESAMAAWLAEHRHEGHGGHRYDLAEFGLAADDVDRAFASYRELFGHLC